MNQHKIPPVISSESATLYSASQHPQSSLRRQSAPNNHVAQGDQERKADILAARRMWEEQEEAKRAAAALLHASVAARMEQDERRTAQAAAALAERARIARTCMLCDVELNRPSSDSEPLKKLLPSDMITAFGDIGDPCYGAWMTLSQSGYQFYGLGQELSHLTLRSKLSCYFEDLRTIILKRVRGHTLQGVDRHTLLPIGLQGHALQMWQAAALCKKFEFPERTRKYAASFGLTLRPVLFSEVPWPPATR